MILKILWAQIEYLISYLKFVRILICLHKKKKKINYNDFHIVLQNSGFIKLRRMFFYVVNYIYYSCIMSSSLLFIIIK